jgi:hypothetical protein
MLPFSRIYRPVMVLKQRLRRSQRRHRHHARPHVIPSNIARIVDCVGAVDTVGAFEKSG